MGRTNKDEASTLTTRRDAFVALSGSRWLLNWFS